MPAKATRSIGCNTCRRRKKGCDLRKPSCGRCEKDGYECNGYARETTFINYEPGSVEPSRLKAIRSRVDRHKQISCRGQIACSPSLGSLHDTRTFDFDPLLDNLAHGAFEIQILNRFLDAYMPRISSTVAKGDSKAWVFTCVGNSTQMNSSSHLLRKTVAALGLSRLARETGDITMERNGAQAYGNALNQLNQVLQSPITATADNTIIPAICLMGLYEQFNGFSRTSRQNQSRNWFAHAQGVARLLQMKGPDGHKSDSDFMAFTSSQLSQFASSFAARRSTFLAQPEWRTVPWIGRTKTPRDQFYDIAFSVPAILEKTDAALLMNEQDDLTEVIEDMLRALDRLRAWHRKYRREMPGTLADLVPEYSMRGYPINHLAEDDAPETYDSDILELMLQFWAVNLNIILNLPKLISSLHPKDQTTYLSSTPDPLFYAAVILRFIPSYLKHGGIYACQTVLYPLGAIRNFLHRAFAAQPDTTTNLGILLTNAVREMEYVEVLEGFLGGIPTIRDGGG